jgi:hypothetical protein
MYSNGIMGLNAPVIGQNDVYPGSNQSASEYATSAQTPVSSSAINAGYEPRTDAYSGQMMASGGIASIRHFDDGGQAQGHWEMNGDSGRYVEAAPKTESTWTPDQPVKLQSMDQMLAGDASGKDFKPTEHGYEWNGAGFANPNGSALSVDSNGFVTQALPSLKDYEFNGKYWNPAGENISWNPEKNQTAYKIGGVEVPIEREATKGIAAFTDAEGKPRMQMDQNNLPIFTLPEGTRFTGDWVNTYAPYITSALLGGTTALASGAFGAGTTMAGEAAGVGATGTAPAASTMGSENAFSGWSPTGSTAGYAGSTNVAAGAPIGADMAGGYATTSNALNIASNAPNAATHGLDFGSNFTWNLPSTGMTTMQKLALGSLAAKGLTSGSGGSSGGAPTQTSSQNTAQATPAPVVQAPMPYAFPTYSPNQSYPGMNYSPTPYAQPMLYRYAEGGIAGLNSGDLGSYSDGGRLLKGGGTGLSDDIPATIGGNQPARLADGEFVVSSDVVSALGGGSTDSGAKKLYAMMDRIRKNAHGTKRQIRAINDKKVLPA